MKQSSGHIMTGDILIIIFAGDAMSEYPKTKDCLTCKWEPEWEDDDEGDCKIIPPFVCSDRFCKCKNGLVSYYSNIVKNCTLWEAK